MSRKTKLSLLTILTTSLIIIFFLNSCNFFLGRKASAKDELRCFKVIQNFPLINDNGKLLSYDTMVAWVYYYRDQVLYYSAYTFNKYESMYSEPIPEERYRQFVYTKGSEYGSLYDKYTSEFNKPVLVDSMLQWEWTTRFTVFELNKYKLVLLSTHTNRRLGTLYERSSFKGIKDTGRSGIIELSFSRKLRKGGFSLSEELDSIKNMKLYEVHTHNNSRFMKENHIQLGTIEEYWKLEEIAVTNREEILEYFNRDRDAHFSK